MITSALLHLLTGVMVPFASLVSFTVPGAPDLTSGAAALGGMVGVGNRYLPIVEAMALIVAGFAFDLTLTGARFLLFIWHNVPVIGGSD